jgi:hypothetical protein
VSLSGPLGKWVVAVEGALILANSVVDKIGLMIALSGHGQNIRYWII